MEAVVIITGVAPVRWIGGGENERTKVRGRSFSGCCTSRTNTQAHTAQQSSDPKESRSENMV